MEIDLGKVWQDYQLVDIEQKISSLFPDNRINVEDLFSKILSGDIIGGIADTLHAAVSGIAAQFNSLKEVFIWIMILGIMAALISHFIEIFDNHQIADIGFYFTYLLMIAILMKCFLSASLVAAETIDKIVTFIQIFIPAYFLSVGVATGALTATVGYQLILLIIYLIEHVLLTIILPLIYSYVLLSVINGIWIEDKLSLLVDGLEKVIRFLLKASLGVVTGISALQSMITPAIDSVKATALQKTVSAIPGVGDVADGVVEVVLGSAVVIKNSIGLVMLLILVAIAAAPLLEILITAFLLKAAAAFLGIVSDKRVTACTDKVGNGSQLLFKTTGTSLLLFLITVSIAAYTTNRGF
ncbi:MAG TPA: stage III sporulation protein AE [Lachnospiraceae bacterium]|nr:stage III sporulation protein AE [Lachnospiraceae bacterium]